MAKSPSKFKLNKLCNASSSKEVCPLCALPPESSYFRLEYCQHLYCLECLKTLIIQAWSNGRRRDQLFLILCSDKKCSKPISLSDIQLISSKIQTDITEGADKSLKRFFDHNKEDLYFCPADSCSMFVYKKDILENKWNCPSCDYCICVNCNVVYHEGVSCDEYDEQNFIFKSWMKEDRCIKWCPNCTMNVEKKEGLNTVICHQCGGVKLCWLCLRIYSSSKDLYDHIIEDHSGPMFDKTFL